MNHTMQVEVDSSFYISWNNPFMVTSKVHHTFNPSVLVSSNNSFFFEAYSDYIVNQDHRFRIVAPL